MSVTSLVAVLAPRAGKIVKNGLCVFERRKFATKWYITHLVQSIVRNHAGKLEFTQTKNT